MALTVPTTTAGAASSTGKKVETLANSCAQKHRNVNDCGSNVPRLKAHIVARIFSLEPSSGKFPCICSRSQYLVMTQTKATSRLKARLSVNEPLIEWAGDERRGASEREGYSSVENRGVN